MHVFDDGAGALKGRIAGIYALLIAANVAVWVWALVAFADRPQMLGIALLAYVFGLRHAVDADHIAAIDNVVRKLMQEGKRPLGVGMFFSLGHSTVVVLAATGVAASAAALQGRFADLKAVGGIVSTSLSAGFLLVIALANLAILRGVWRRFREVRRTGRLAEDGLDMLFAGGGLLARLFRPLFRGIGRSWHMYPIGFLFGLGFDTASEIGLLGISAAQAADGMSLWATLIFPALFTAGMALVDCTNSILMVGAYGWAFVKPIRKLWYNMTITAISVIVALIVGGLEAFGLIADKLGATGTFWDAVAALNDDLGAFGFVVIGVFVASWIVSAAIYRWRRFDDLVVTTAEP